MLAENNAPLIAYDRTFQ